MLKRRGFLAAIASALTLDPERLLWVPGKKVISIVKPKEPLLQNFYRIETKPTTTKRDFYEFYGFKPAEYPGKLNA